MIYFIYILAVVIFVAIDQISKSIVISTMKLSQKVVLIENFFSLTHVRNYGAGFSILQNARLFLTVISIVTVIVLSYMLITSNRKDKVLNISYLFIISGAIGNLIDRINNGYVTDFLDFIIFGYDFPVFNVADCFITVGCFLMIIMVLKDSKSAKN